jgi:hypothetical protein
MAVQSAATGTPWKHRHCSGKFGESAAQAALQAFPIPVAAPASNVLVSELSDGSSWHLLAIALRFAQASGQLKWLVV